MPELPEVETITRQLREKVVGLTIRDVEVKKERLFKGDPKDLIGVKVQDVKRRAKNIIIDLKPKVHPAGVLGLHLSIHLKMTGQLIFVDPTSLKLRGASKKGKFGGGHPIPPFNTEVPNKYTYIIFSFSDGSHLYYNDLRQFGWFKIVSDEILKQEFKKFGPEPLDKKFTVEIFKTNLQKYPRKKIKSTLMEQGVVAGLGNIYAAEVCFQAGILPTRTIATLTNEDYTNLYQAIKKVLTLAIKYKGTSSDNYVTLEGKQGTYGDRLWVYGREGLPCSNGCGGKVKKIKLGGRGTCFCPKCQK